ncbi:MAG: LAGLIDADG endonuclease [Actinomycetota bacterium]
MVANPKGNLVGSREALVTERCRDVIIGTVLGDGCLERNGANVRLRVDHSFAQKQWVDWKFRELSELRPSPPRIIRRLDERTGQTHVNYRFSTMTTERLNQFFDLFYRHDVAKSIPESVDTLIRSPLVLAVWYMDDGGRRSDCRSGYLNTNAYLGSDVQVLRDALQTNFGISTRTHYAAAKPRIYIPASQFAKFCDLIRPHVIPEMAYKLL